MIFYIFVANKHQMNKIYILIITIFLATNSFAQKKEKIKGTKVVTIVKHDKEPFTEIEVEDNLEVFLIKSDKNSVEIETDENLHEIINHKVYGTTLRLNTNKDVVAFKTLVVKVMYTDSLKMISLKHESKLNSIQPIQLSNITIKTYDFSKSFINVNTPNFILQSNDKSKVELNLKSEDAFIEMSKNSEIKALISSNKLKFDMYQKSEAIIEGDVNEMKLRLDNNAVYLGQKLTSKVLNLTTEGYTKCGVNTNGNLSISASGKSEVSIYGEPKIELKKFSENATLFKKSK